MNCVQVVRRWNEAVRQWQESSAELDELSAVMAEVFDEAIEFYPARKFPEAAPCHGLIEFARWMARYLEAWSFDLKIEELVAVGEDRVLDWGMLHAQGRASGVRMAGELFECHWLQEGRIVRVEHHLTLKGALQAFGLHAETLEAAGLRS